MLRSLKDLEHYTVHATNGDVGSVVDFLLDDERWIARYLVVEAGGFFEGRRVLISPVFFRQVDWSTRRFHLALSMDKVKNSPSVDVDKPVSRQHERDYYRYYGYPYYWLYAEPWGMGLYPASLPAGGWRDEPVTHAHEAPGDIHLRSAKEVCGYHIQGSDKAIGHVDDFIIDDETWEVRYLAIDTRNWWLDRKVLISPQWASGISWEERRVYVDLTRQTIKSSPEWDSNAAINRKYEARLFDYYGRPAYWAGGNVPEQARPPLHPPSAHV